MDCDEMDGLPDDDGYEAMGDPQLIEEAEAHGSLDSDCLNQFRGTLERIPAAEKAVSEKAQAVIDTLLATGNFANLAEDDDLVGMANAAGVSTPEVIELAARLAELRGLEDGLDQFRTDVIDELKNNDIETRLEMPEDEDINDDD
jgi:hypothetical protein